MPTQSEFFRAVLPAAGIYCIAVKKPGHKGWVHLKFDSLDALVSRLGQLQYDQANYYFAISSFEKATVTVGGETRFRTQSNALFTRVLILDVDIKVDNPKFPPDRETALADLAAFTTQYALPQPIVVDSGGGLHVYWPMAAAISSKEWVKYGKALRTAAELGYPRLVADPSRVADSASVLRIPDSFNLKYNPPAPVQIIQWSDEQITLDHLRSVLPVLDGIPLVSFASVPRDEIPPVSLKTTARNCNWLGKYMMNAAAASEPEWYAILGLAPYMTHQKNGKEMSGEDIAQLLSSDHPQYSADATSIKFAQVKTAQTGPTSCARLQSLNASRCAACPFAGSVKSPAQAGRLDRPATAPVEIQAKTHDDAGNVTVEMVTIPLPPKPYFRGTHGGVYVRVMTPASESAAAAEHIECIYDYDLYPTKRYRTEIMESEQLELHCWLPKDGLRRIKMPTELLADHKKLNVYLSGRGIVAKSGYAQRVTKYMIDYARHLQLQESAETEYSRFGWRDVNTASPKFVVAEGVYDSTGTLTPAAFAGFLKEASATVSTAGSIDKWREGFNVYRDIPNTEAFQFTALLGFAAPLLALTEYSGVYYNMVGETAAGKSTALKFMTSVWGEPNPDHIKENDTQISMYNFIGYLSSIPVAYDEVTKLDGDRLSDFVLTFTGGRGKMRAARDGQNITNNIQWDTIVCGTSNTSVFDRLAAARTGYSAEAMRVFEVFVDISHPEYKNTIDRAVNKLRENYGLAGREFIKYVIPRAKGLRKVIDDITISIVKKGELRNSERFWAVMLACVQVGATIAQSKLGLHNYDLDKLMKWALQSTVNARETVVAVMTDPGTILGEFFNAHIDSLIRVNNGSIDLGVDGNKPRQIKARIESVNGVPTTGYISSTCIRQYCIQNKIDFAWLRRELQNLRILTRDGMNKRLAAGTNLVDTPVRVWEIDLNAAGVRTPNE